MMRERISILAAILWLFLLVAPNVSPCMGDAAGMLEDARGMVEAGQYSQARTALQNIIQTYPDQEQAIWAQSDLARMELRLKNDGAAEAVIANLKTAYAGNAFTAHALHDIAYMYHARKRYGEACELFQYVLDKFPENEYEMLALGGLATASLKRGDMVTGNAAAERLITEFRGHKDMAILAHDVATGYVHCKNYELAKGFFTYALESNPPTEHKMWSLIGLARAKIRLGEYAEVHPIIDRLISEFQGDERLPKELGGIANVFRDASRDRDAEIVYEKTYSLFPNNNYTNTARLDVAKGYVRSLIDSGDEAGATVAINSMIADYQGDAGLASALDDLGHRYQQLNRYEAARQVYQKILEHCPGDASYATKAKIIVDVTGVLPLIDTGQHQAVRSEINRFIAQYQSHNDLPVILTRFVGERYYIKGLEYEKQGRTEEERAYLREAVAIWEKVLAELPASKVTPEACHWAGDCCARLGDYKKAAQFYKRVADDYPAYEMRWHTLFMLGRSYQCMAERGIVSKTEADVSTRAAYQMLLGEYPDSNAAKAASIWLNR